MSSLCRRDDHVNIIQDMMSVFPLSICVRMVTLTYTRHDVRVSSLNLCQDGHVNIYKTWCQGFLSQSLCRDDHVNIIQDMKSVCPLILCVGMITLTSYKTWCQCFLSLSLCRDGHVNIIQDMMSVCPLILCVGMVTLTSYKTWCQCVLSFSVSG